MSLDERDHVLTLFENESFVAGETILQEGNSTQMLWIILEGECEVIKHCGNSSERQLAVLNPGAVFGEMSFFQEAPHSATVRTLSDVDVMRLPRKKFDELRDKGSVAAYKIAASTAVMLSDRLRRMDDWTCELVEHSGVAVHKEEWQEFRAKLYSDWQF